MAMIRIAADARDEADRGRFAPLLYHQGDDACVDLLEQRHFGDELSVHVEGELEPKRKRWSSNKARTTARHKMTSLSDVIV